MKLKIILILFFAISYSINAQNMSMRGEEYKTVKYGKEHKFSEWVEIRVKNGSNTYVLFTDNSYNLALEVYKDGEGVDKEKGEYLKLRGTE